MTNLEALKASVAGYPLKENTFLKALLDRDVSATGTYAGKTEEFELATADIYMILATAANVSEGGFSVSVSERKNFLNMANAIYDKYDEGGVSNTIQDASNKW